MKSDIKTDDNDRMLLDLCISCQCRILNGRTLGDTVGNLTHFNITVVQLLIIVLLIKNYFKMYIFSKWELLLFILITAK